MYNVSDHTGPTHRESPNQWPYNPSSLLAVCKLSPLLRSCFLHWFCLILLASKCVSGHVLLYQARVDMLGGGLHTG
jgi:hypothetical protein